MVLYRSFHALCSIPRKSNSSIKRDRSFYGEVEILSCLFLAILFSFLVSSNRFHRNQFECYSLDFLGYSSNVKRNHLVVRSQILEYSVLIDTIIKRFDNIVPVILLIRSLSKASLCTVVGHPISKPIWTDLSDYDIISRFGRIWKNLFHFYSDLLKREFCIK
ncbi:hypothetical protein LUZ63_022676 [Rhynchospora breviuscula]|uniref:Domain X domain-containing protein n=1 Tax=Rhynchospora breviuscula TaxID=2022672 RepID=A0A9P9Z5Q0_9POAL|nr:hypothetical protein LUZ63_022676 [Rhynchospora breviuscula]